MWIMIGGQRRRSFNLSAAGRKKFIVACLASLVIYILFCPREYDVSFSGDIPGAEPVAVWEYLADFNNMKRLNPTIETFFITYDNGTYYVWEYGVYYTEHLSNFPLVKNSANAHYKVYKDSKPPEKYVIASEHRTCFLGKRFCVNSSSTFICMRKSQSYRGTTCREDVKYECPWLTSMLCHSEVMHQRKSIFRNLIRELSLSS